MSIDANAWTRLNYICLIIIDRPNFIKIDDPTAVTSPCEYNSVCVLGHGETTRRSPRSIFPDVLSRVPRTSDRPSTTQDQSAFEAVEAVCRREVGGTVRGGHGVCGGLVRHGPRRGASKPEVVYRGRELPWQPRSALTPGRSSVFRVVRKRSIIRGRCILCCTQQPPSSSSASESNSPSPRLRQRQRQQQQQQQQQQPTAAAAGLNLCVVFVPPMSSQPTREREREREER